MAPPGPAWISIRPEDMSLAAAPGLSGALSRLASSSVIVVIRVRAGADTIVVDVPHLRHDAVHAVGSEIGLMLDPDGRHRAALEHDFSRPNVVREGEQRTRHRRGMKTIEDAIEIDTAQTQMLSICSDDPIAYVTEQATNK